MKYLSKLAMLSLCLAIISACGGGGRSSANTEEQNSISGSSQDANGESVVENAPLQDVTIENIAEETVDNNVLNDQVNSIEQNEAVANDIYQPDAALLSENASSSNDLYVESSFRFENFRTFTVNITAADQEGSPIGSTIIKISSIAAGITDLNDQRINERELLSLFKTDTNGQLYQTLELPRNVTSVLLELDAIGVENAVILNIGEVSSITHQFL